ncbi:DUF2798 domain-containing protein [Weissella soli]|uniref:DUF2798 domain-containing protein n=1 Tax=Weissella soli TaxID=155866 RepID=UPI003C760334
MPHNFKEELIFTFLMAGLMVLGMTSYNVFLQNGFSDTLANEIILGFPLGFLVALICDLIVIGPIAKQLAFKFIIPKYMLKGGLQIGITISLLMILGMVTCMSLFGILISKQALAAYPSAWLMNIVVALPLQLLLVGPLSRKVLALVQN